jgi:hypothetical protein
VRTLDRRRAIVATATTLAALSLPAPLLARGASPALFIFDARIARARAAAAAYAAAGVPLLERNAEDLGQAWHERIPRTLRASRGPLAGLTLWVDSFVCETFGREDGMVMRREPGRPGDDLQAWIMA